MIYASMLAGGSGTRLAGTPVPKQFFMLGDYPIFIHAIKTFLKDERIVQIWIGANGSWFDLAVEQIKQYIGEEPRIHIVEGGADREETLHNTLNGICCHNTILDEDIILIHDAVRPFATQRIIDDLIKEMDFCDACNTVVSLNDTVVEAIDGNIITGMPPRSTLFAGQSPQGFKINALIKALASLAPDVRKAMTETTKAFFAQGIPIHTVKGDPLNFKITTPYDLELANFLLKYMETKVTKVTHPKE